jgi:hypothetical protein
MFYENNLNSCKLVEMNLIQPNIKGVDILIYRIYWINQEKTRFYHNSYKFGNILLII